MYEKHDLICRIHRLEDKLLRGRDIQYQLEMQKYLMFWRKKLQILEWEESI